MKAKFKHSAIMTALIGATIISTSAPVFAKDKAGTTVITRGKVQATEISSETSRRLKRRSPIYDVDKVTTNAKSQTQLRMTDGGMISLKENSELLITDYEFNATDQTGSVVMELVKGGLRSVTGAIKSDKGNYQLKTPVGSIGIRGTHYEIEIIQGEVFIAVWDGAVDVTVDVSGNEQEVGLGEGEDYSYAKIDESGEVTELLEPPENFNEGHSSDPETEEEETTGGEGEGESEGEAEGESESSEGEEEGEEESESEEGEEEGEESEEGSEEESAEEGSEEEGSEEEGSSEEGGSQEEGSEESGEGDGQTSQTDGEGSGDQTGGDEAPSEEEVVADSGSEDGGTPIDTQEDEEVVVVEEEVDEDSEFISEDNVEESVGLTPEEEIANLVAQRTGIFTYNQVSELVFETEQGTNFEASMTIDFDTAEITTGHISFNDSNGEWFAAFNGFVNGHEIQLGVNFASHGNNLADGNIDAGFIDGIDGILNSFDLFEIDNTNIRAKGVFKLHH